MKSTHLYAAPTRVYVLLGLFAAIGVFCGTVLPISLFPNSSKPVIYVWSDYGDSTTDEFMQSYGDDLENQLRSVAGAGTKVEKVEAFYDSSSVNYTVTFAWGVDPTAAKREVDAVTASWSARVPAEVRDNLGVYLDNENSGFLAISFFSDTRSLDDLYEILEPALKGPIATVDEADQPEIWNPSRKEIRIELKPDALASLQLLPRDVERAINQAMTTRDGGSLTVGLNQFRIQMPRAVSEIDSIGKIPLVTPAGRIIHLSDIASIDFGPKSKSTRIIKTSGAPSVMLYATPKPGANIKRMAEQLIDIVEKTMPKLPSDIKFHILVDPSSFIRSAIENVFHEVGIGSLLAVSVLFIFIGSFRNVVTAAIEIPLSLVLAFILMRLAGINLNLISLGGLALSAGMNVDASVVVMENIFRHFEKWRGQKMSMDQKLQVILGAVAEVRAPIISSTIASLVVFLPLLMTSGLGYAILGDLAKAVIFSHGFSAIVALVLVPTVRLHLMRGETVTTPAHSFCEPVLKRIESGYARILRGFIATPWLRWSTYLAVAATLPLLIWLILPKLPREVVGTPDSDIVMLGMNTQGNTLIKQMESMSDEVEHNLLMKFGDKIQYTFTSVKGPNRSSILARLKRKEDMQSVWAAMEAEFVNTPQMRFRVEPWNPSELPIPNPPELRVAIRGGEIVKRRDITLELSDLLESKQVFPRIYSNPSVERVNGLQMHPNLDQWAVLGRDVARFLTPADLLDLSRVATEGRRIGKMTVKGRDTDLMMNFPSNFVRNGEDLGALPVGLGSKIVPLKSLLNMERVELPPAVYHENGEPLYTLFGRLAKSGKSEAIKARAEAEALIKAWQKDQDAKDAKKATGGVAAPSGVSIMIEDAAQDITTAIDQLGLAILGSILLIFVVLLIQFGSFGEAILVLVAVPLGFIGVLASLFIFRSTLSLNSTLGVILLNGIAVNNSIILVDFIRRLWSEGHSPIDAALTAAKLRLRPILITSLTTVLGMLPIALGFGEGGRILQPLGIAVSGGLWISMLLTLLLVPALQVAYLEWLDKRKKKIPDSLLT